jgi:hypothetical protein
VIVNNHTKERKDSTKIEVRKGRGTRKRPRKVRKEHVHVTDTYMYMYWKGRTHDHGEPRSLFAQRPINAPNAANGRGADFDIGPNKPITIPGGDRNSERR